MTKSELIEILLKRQAHLSYSDVEQAVNMIMDSLSDSLINNERIEIRGFGSFSLHHRAAKQGRNPKTGESIALPAKRVAHFKPGKELRERVNERRNNQ